MPNIKLSKIAKELNVGLGTIVDFMHENGYKDFEMNPNARLTDEQVDLLNKKYNRMESSPPKVGTFKLSHEVLTSHYLKSNHKNFFTMEQKQENVDSIIVSRISELLKTDSEGHLLYENSEIIEQILDEVYNVRLEAQLKTYYEYEKHCLDMLKEYKEEIKFASALQEDLRKERAKFFSEKLKEVSATLKDAEVDDKVRGEWIKELVKSYTRSLDISDKLVEEHVVETINDIKGKQKEIVEQIKK